MINVNLCLPFSCGVAVDCTVSSVIILYLTAMGQQIKGDQRLINNLILEPQYISNPFIQMRSRLDIVFEVLPGGRVFSNLLLDQRPAGIAT